MSGEDIAEDAANMAAQASGGEASELMESTEPIGPAEPPGDSGGTSVVEALLHTEPDDSVSDYPDLPEHAAHAIIGLKKVADAMGVEGVSGGTPAVVNFVQASMGYYQSADHGSAEGQDEIGDMEVVTE